MLQVKFKHGMELSAIKEGQGRLIPTTMYSKSVVKRSRSAAPAMGAEEMVFCLFSMAK